MTNQGLIDLIEGFKNLAFINLYNPYLSTIGYGISADFTGVQIYISKALNPNASKKQPAKGENVFDHAHKILVTLSPSECYELVRNCQKIISGTYVNPKSNNEESKNSLIFFHFPFKNKNMGKDKEPSICSFGPAKDNNGNLTNCLRITLIPPQSIKEQSYMASYIFRQGSELDQFLYFMNNVATNLPFIQQVMSATFKSVAKFTRIGSGSNKNQQDQSHQNTNSFIPQQNQPYQNNNQQSFRNNQNYNTQPQNNNAPPQQQNQSFNNFPPQQQQTQSFNNGYQPPSSNTQTFQNNYIPQQNNMTIPDNKEIINPFDSIPSSNIGTEEELPF